jgi:hypothetical protein
MGEVRVDASGVRTAARRVLDAVDALNEIPWHGWDPDALAGSSVGGMAAPTVAADRMARLAAQLQAWAAAAQGSMTAFERVEGRSVDRLDRR